MGLTIDLPLSGPANQIVQRNFKIICQQQESIKIGSVGTSLIKTDIPVRNAQQFAQGLLGNTLFCSQFPQNFTKVTHNKIPLDKDLFFLYYEIGLKFPIEVFIMNDILSILQYYAEELPPGKEARAVSQKNEPYFRRLCTLTSVEEADNLWSAALETGAAECSADFRRGFAMGVRLWEEVHQVDLTR